MTDSEACIPSAAHPEYLAGLKTGRSDMAGEISLLNAVIREHETEIDRLRARVKELEDGK